MNYKHTVISILDSHPFLSFMVDSVLVTNSKEKPQTFEGFEVTTETTDEEITTFPESDPITEQAAEAYQDEYNKQVAIDACNW